MLVLFSPIFLADTKIIFSDKFVARLIVKWILPLVNTLKFVLKLDFIWLVHINLKEKQAVFYYIIM